MGGVGSESKRRDVHDYRGVFIKNPVCGGQHLKITSSSFSELDRLYTKFGFHFVIERDAVQR
jgi:hypothetical protein